LDDQPSVWARTLLDQPPLSWTLAAEHRHARTWEVYTDASKTGYGILIFRDDAVTSAIAGRWDDFLGSLHINELEAHTVLLALDIVSTTWHSSRTLQPERLRLSFKVDNTTAISIATTGTSRSFFLNHIATNIQQHQMYPNVEQISYVRSVDNKADWLSRLAAPLVSSFHAAAPSAALVTAYQAYREARCDQRHIFPLPGSNRSERVATPVA
jgi:hypothetical protein